VERSDTGTAVDMNPPQAVRLRSESAAAVVFNRFI
jgi:hypothetical protein